MRGSGLKASVSTLLLSALGLLYAQTPPAPVATPEAPKLGGTATADLITLRAGGPGTPLRYGNVVAGSEHVTLDGRILTVTEEYAMDYEAGVVYLKVPQKTGATLTVTYRYLDTPDPQAATRRNGLKGFKFTLVPGGLNAVMGLGFAERTADGRVMTGDAFGLQNSLRFAGGTLSGVYVYASRRQADNRAGMQMRAETGGQAGGETGQSQAIVQQFRSRLSGGQLTVDYQDVGENFAAFNSLAEAGAGDQVNRLRQERGLTRIGFSLDGAKVGGLSVRSGYRKLSDRDGTLSWRSYGATVGGLAVDWRQQEVGAGFSRFKDIAEGDREQLERERGIRRENLAATFDAKVGKLSFGSDRVEDLAAGKGLRRQELAFDSARFKFSRGEQEVDSGFARMGNLLGDEQGRYGLEVGMRRMWTSLQASFGANANLEFRQTALAGAGGKFASTDVALKGKTWNLEHRSRTADKGFAGFAGLKPEEQDGHAAAVATMYGPGVQSRPEDRAGLLLGAGLSRSYTSLSAQPFRGWDLQFSQLDLSGPESKGSVQAAKLQAGSTVFSYRRQSLTDTFAAYGNLMSFEQMALGNVAGLDRTDLGFSTSFGRGKQFQFDQTVAGVGKTGFSRQRAQYTDKKIEVAVNTRSVDPGYAALATINDPERDLLRSLEGYRATDARLKWQILPNFTIEGSTLDAVNDATNVANRIRNYSLDWRVNGKTRLAYSRQEQRVQDPTNVLFANLTQRFSFERDLGRYGTLQFLDEKIEFEGSLADRPDSHKQYLAYGTKLSRTTEVKSEQTRTTFGDGTAEKVSSNTLSTTVTKNVGVSVTDTAIDRDGDEKDEKHRNYGFWLDLGRGVRIQYGYVRQMVGEAAGQASTSLAIGQDAQRINPDQTNTVQQANVGGVLLGGGYGTNTWDGTHRTQGFTNLALTTAKPFSFAGLTGVKLHFGMDTASDLGNWLRENRLGQFSAKAGSTEIGFDYLSQMHPTGTRGIDRTYRFQTDQGSRPWLKASVFYKVRTLPWDDQVMIRNYALSARLKSNLELSHRLQTNPEEARSDLFLGSQPRPERTSEWALDWKRSKNLTFGGSWVERISDQNEARSRTGFLNLTLFEASGSPLRLQYGLEEATGNQARRTNQRYSIQFDQRPGPNQIFSLYLANMSYDGYVAENELKSNITFRLNYQLRF